MKFQSLYALLHTDTNLKTQTRVCEKCKLRVSLIPINESNLYFKSPAWGCALANSMFDIISLSQVVFEIGELKFGGKLG
jgi:hypothetical protein